MDKQEITIILSQVQANIVTLLLQQGVFNIRNGSATINFGANGEISSIVRNDTLFNARVKLDTKSV